MLPDGRWTYYIYVYQRNWLAPTRIGQLGTQYAGKVLSVALDTSEEWLYFVDANKNLLVSM